MALIAVVAMTTACQNWSQFLGNPGHTGDAPGETAVTAANVASLTPAFSVPVAADVAGQSAPTASGGKLFVTTGFAAIFSLDPADGKEVWSSSVSAPVRGAPLVFGDRVFAVSIDNKLHALAAVDGSDLWTFSGLQEVAGYIGGNSPAGSGDIVVAPFTSGELVGLRLENGRPVWNESLVGPRREARAFGNLADIRGRPVIDRGVVLAMGSAGTMAAIDLNSGQRLWERPIGGNQTPWAASCHRFGVSSGFTRSGRNPPRPRRPRWRTPPAPARARLHPLWTTVRSAALAGHTPALADGPTSVARIRDP
jgi:outer membrane protein assembly factor BamB